MYKVDHKTVKDFITSKNKNITTPNEEEKNLKIKTYII